MAYVIFKYTEIDNKKKTVIVNNSEGEPIEFDTYERAEEIAKLFQSNTTHNSIYEVKKLS